jgi:quercetin dioxygenase-like cupin family protein
VAFRVPPQQPEGKAAWAAPMITEGEPAMHSPLRRAAKALAGLVVAAGFALAAAPPGGAASIGEGATEKQILSEKLPNVPGKTLTVIEVDYPPGGFSAPHRHPASGFVFAYVLSGTVRSQIEGEPLRVYRAGQSRPIPTTSSAPMRAIADLRRRLRQIPNIRTNAWNTILLPRGFRATGRGGVRAVFAWVLDNGYAAGDGSQRACEVRTAEPARTARRRNVRPESSV